jgi:hypothetical protein
MCVGVEIQLHHSCHQYSYYIVKCFNTKLRTPSEVEAQSKALVRKRACDDDVMLLG